MITIEVNNNKGKLFGKKKILLKIQKHFKVRNPNAFYIRKRMGARSVGWDGKINYINDSFQFNIGLLPMITNYIDEELGKKIDVIDYRKELGIKPKKIKKIGDKTPYPYQLEAIESIVFNNVMGLSFPIGVIKAATNAGKTLMMAGIFLSYKKKIPALMLLNDGDLFEQFKKELPELLPNVDLGFVRGSKAENEFKNFTVAMVQSVSRNIKKYEKHLVKFGILLVDEADLADNKTYKTCITKCYNASVKVGLSGTIYMSKLAKDKPKTMNLKGVFSEIVFEIDKKTMQNQGYSTKVIVRMIKGYIGEGVKGDFAMEYKTAITLNKSRTLKAIRRVKFNAKLNRLPALVICQYHEHIEYMYKMFKKHLGNIYSIAYVHGGVHKKYRNKIISDFREGKIDILIGSFILRRGKNFPKLRYILNAAGSDSQETVDQILGRLERKDEDKEKAYMEDFFDEGHYLKTHSKHRQIYYKKMGLKVKTI